MFLLQITTEEGLHYAQNIGACYIESSALTDEVSFPLLQAKSKMLPICQSCHFKIIVDTGL